PAPISCSVVIGKRRTRTPVACHTALAIAPAVPVMPISPTPLIPSAFTCGSCSSIRMASSDGTSALTGTWYSARFAFITRPERGSSGLLVGWGLGTAVFPAVMFQGQARAVVRRDGTGLVELG